MNKFDFGIITLSYAPDFQRCKLLSWSIEQFISPSVTHYIIVDARDLKLFSQLKNSTTEIISVESVLPWWIKHVPFVKNGWLSLKTIFIRNWLLQQIVKIASAQYIDKNVFVFIDSDVTFIRPFNFQSFIREDKVRLFHVPSSIFPQNSISDKWHQSAGRLLGLPQLNYPVPGYVGNIITWRRDNLLKLYEHLESMSGRGWIETVCGLWHLSEYVLYGVFVDQVLQASSGHYHDSQRICSEYWSSKTMSDEQLHKFFAELLPDDKAIMISAKAGISVERYETLVKNVYLSATPDCKSGASGDSVVEKP